ncbi:RNA-directed DNA polymerase from transposon X-element [Ceratobasidium sp. AG-Ba]|nr:RNA-directed DNA polymerase from transposon X-element [Ceratobasidium sp. AG-Ba]
MLMKPARSGPLWCQGSLAQVVFNLAEPPKGVLDQQASYVQCLISNGVARTHLACFVELNKNGSLTGDIEYHSDIFARESITSFAAAFTHILDTWSAVPARSIASVTFPETSTHIPVLRSFDEGSWSFGTFLASSAAEHWDRQAVFDDTTGSSYTYQQLFSIAHVIQAQLAPFKRTDGVNAIAAEIAVKFAGLVFAPCDVAAPRLLIEEIISKCNSVCALAHRAAQRDSPLMGSLSELVIAKDGQGAYTGKSKGIVIGKGSLVKLFTEARRWVGHDVPINFVTTTSLAFDAIFSHIWLPLATGGCVTLPQVSCSQARVVLGALRSTPIVHLDAFSSLLPMRCLLNETCQRSAIRLATVPNEHPLYKDVKRTLRTGRKRHASPLHNILKYIGKIPPFELEQWTFKQCETPPLTVPRNLFPSPNAAIWEHRVEQARTKVYADGARNKAGVGAGAVLQIHDRMRAWTGARLGDRDDATVLEAELAGIWLALHALNRLRYIEEAVIYSDSQLAIACIEGSAVGAPKSLLTPIRKLLSRVKNRPDCTRLNLKWCPAHKEILGNVLADKETKLAAKGERYPHDLVPQGLENYRRCITRHLAKELTKQCNRFYANRAWRNTPAGLKLLGRYPLIEPSEFLNLTAGLNRAQATLVFRIATGHVQLHAHLHALRLVDSPACRACGEARETVSHFVLFCPKYTAIRQHVLTTRGRDFLSLSFLLSSRSGIQALLEYVRRTGRLTNYLR